MEFYVSGKDEYKGVYRPSHEEQAVKKDSKDSAKGSQKRKRTHRKNQVLEAVK